MNDTRKAVYSARFRMVCHYIERHLDEPLLLEALSAIAHCSPFHFHRMFTAWSGMPLYRYIQWLRLRHASWRLAFNPHDKLSISPWMRVFKIRSRSVAPSKRR